MSSGQTINSYATLVQAIQDWLARADITDANWSPELIQIAEANIYNGFVDNKGNYWPGLRVRQMEKSFTGGSIATITITAGGSYSSAPTVSFAAAPTGGITATGVAVLTGTAVTGISLTNPGNGYISAPAITFGSGAATATCTLSANPQVSKDNNFAIPSDYLDTQFLYLTAPGGNTVRLERKPAEWLYQYWGGSSPDTPTYFSRSGSVFIFGPTSDSQYTLSGIYYSQGAPLSSTNTTDWVILNYPNLALAAALSEVCAFIRDDQGTQYWMGRLTNLMATIQMQDKRERYSGSPLAMVPG
jgi:hypothetical protein